MYKKIFLPIATFLLLFILFLVWSLSLDWETGPGNGKVAEDHEERIELGKNDFFSQEADFYYKNKQKEECLETKISRALDVGIFEKFNNHSSGSEKLYHGVVTREEVDFFYMSPGIESNQEFKFQVVPQTLFIEEEVNSDGETTKKEEIGVEDFFLYDSVVVVGFIPEKDSDPKKAMLVKRIIKNEK